MIELRKVGLLLDASVLPLLSFKGTELTITSEKPIDPEALAKLRGGG